MIKRKRLNSVTNEEFTEKKLDVIKAGKKVFKFYEIENPELTKYVSFYIINKIKKLYREMMQSDFKDKYDVGEKLLIDYKYFFSLIRKEIFIVANKKRNFFSLWVFRFNPNLYCWVMKKIIN